AAVPRREGPAAFSAHRATRHGAHARRARPAGYRDAARLAPFLRDASLGARRRSAVDPGTARPRFARHDANLYGGGFDEPDRRLSRGASKSPRLARAYKGSRA